MDIKIAELFNESRQNSKIRDAQLAMPTNKIPDLGWQFDEDVQLIELALNKSTHWNQSKKRHKQSDSLQQHHPWRKNRHQYNQLKKQLQKLYLQKQ